MISKPGSASRNSSARFLRGRSKRIQHYTGSQPVFDCFGVQAQIDAAFHRQVWLPCGGYIVIDETEALIAVDVNTGRNKGAKDIEKTILQTNLEAADEICRQMRLRNVGGIIIADFIDMKSRKDQQAVYQRVRERLKRDKARTHVLPISQLGLMEMTRQRAAESLASTQFVPCPHCNGQRSDQKPHDHECRASARFALRHAKASGYRPRGEGDRSPRSAESPAHAKTRSTWWISSAAMPGASRSVPIPTYHQEKFVIINAVSGEELKP